MPGPPQTGSILGYSMKGDDSRNPMTPEAPRTARFSALHIDVARFATDDFNPFHDRNKWQRIEGNPFGGTIALGFQLIELRAARRLDAARGGTAARNATCTSV